MLIKHERKTIDYDTFRGYDQHPLTLMMMLVM